MAIPEEILKDKVGLFAVCLAQNHHFLAHALSPVRSYAVPQQDTLWLKGRGLLLNSV